MHTEIAAGDDAEAHAAEQAPADASMNANLPAFVVMVTKNKGGQPLYARLWGSGFFASKFEGVQLWAEKDPVLYLHNPDGMSRGARREMLDALAALHGLQAEPGVVGDRVPPPLPSARWAPHELIRQLRARLQRRDSDGQTDPPRRVHYFLTYKLVPDSPSTVQIDMADYDAHFGGA
jgi:hypothetical protein